MRGMQSGVTQHRWWGAGCRARRVTHRRLLVHPPRSVVSRPPEQPEVSDASSASPPVRPAARSLPAGLGAVASFLDDRLQADPRFLSKVGIEVGVDSACTLSAELAARGAAAFGAQWVYVCDDLVTTLLLDVCMVSITAPTASSLAHRVDHGSAPPALGAGSTGLALFVAQAQAVLADCPRSCFEMAPVGSGHPGYTPTQRLLTAVSTAAQYGLLGLLCGGAGQAVTNALAGGATGVGPAELPGVVPVALLWTNYMATSASARYQLVAAVEQQAERLPGLGQQPLALGAISTAVRLCNNIYGAGLFVDMMRESGISP